jgi:hypothetical protein
LRLATSWTGRLAAAAHWPAGYPNETQQAIVQPLSSGTARMLRNDVIGVEFDPKSQQTRFGKPDPRLSHQAARRPGRIGGAASAWRPAARNPRET